MEKAPGGTSVGVEDPYAHVDRCDHLTDEGTCRWAVEHGHHDPAFADERSREEFRCPVAGQPDESGLTGPWDWADCPHFRCRNHDRECVRCGLEARRMAHSDERPLLEEHHLSYRSGTNEGVANTTADADGEAGAASPSSAADGDEAGEPSHEITVLLCRWCHAKVHNSWARIDDDVGPDPEAIARREERRTRERAELDFESAADRYRE